MFFINFDREIISKLAVVDSRILRCHEQVVQERLNSFIKYLESLDGDILLSSIIVCNESNTIIDGHHRYHAMKALGISTMPVTFINYKSEYVMPHENNSITKQEILHASNSGVLLPPKSSKHLIFDKESGFLKPILLISSLYHISLNHS